MKLKKYIYGIALGTLSLLSTSCYNEDKEFPDYEGGTTAYFAYQDPVRTLILGNDIYDNTLDNEHKCQIWSTMGGAYGGRDAYVEIVVDESLCNNLYFIDEGGLPSYKVLPMPSTHYKLGSNTIAYNGNQRGYVEVQFTDAFFNDPKSTGYAYVIPLVMKNVRGIDRILTGTPLEGLTPERLNSDDWDVLPKDYVLYCVKYKNPWDAKYIRRGVDNIDEGGVKAVFVRKDTTLVNSDPGRYEQNLVNAEDEVCAITTKNMTQAIFPISVKRIKDASVPCNLILTFNGNKCTISTEDEDAESTGTGEFITQGTKDPKFSDYQWGNMNGELVHRDILTLSYDVTLKAGKKVGNTVLAKDLKLSATDTLVVQTRESNKKEFFTPKYVKP